MRKGAAMPPNPTPMSTLGLGMGDEILVVMLGMLNIKGIELKRT